MFDKHLFFYFANQNKLRHLCKQKIINRRFQIIEPSLKKLAQERSRLAARVDERRNSTLSHFVRPRLPLRKKGTSFQAAKTQNQHFSTLDKVEDQLP